MKARHPRGIDAALLVVFFVSGGLALIYQAGWVRAITLELGSTTLAVSTVVATFMGGLALGSAAAGRWGDRTRRPLLVYAVLEVGLSLYALATPLMIRSVLPALSDGATLLADSIVKLSILRLVVAGVLLLPPTILMGATLPILARWWALRRSASAPGDGALGAGLLYSANTLGAFAGTLAAGFLLLPTLGLRATVLWAGSLNLVVALVSLLLDRAAAPLPTAVAGSRERFGGEPPIRLTGSTLAIGLTAFGALACEVAWTRLIALVSGGSVYAFTIVLATFLGGLGLGAAAVSLAGRAERFDPRQAFCVLAVWAGALVAMSYLASLRLPALFVDLFGRFRVDEHPERAVIVQFLLVAMLLLPPATAMGGLLPAAARLRVVTPERTSHEVSGIYVASTVGSILGSLFTGLLLIPWIGIRGSLAIAVCSQIGGALALAHEGRLAGGASRLPLRLAAPIALTVITLAQPWPADLMTSGVYDKAHLRNPGSARQIELRVERGTELLYYRDGLTATVTVTRDRRSPDADLYISTNGKIDGSSHFDMPTQRLSAHLPLVLHPAPRQMCVIGLGTGCTAGSAALHPVQVTAIEIEPAMVEGARLFAAHNHGVVDDPNVDLRVTDGRLFLRLNPGRLDVIVSEPSNPWLAGTSDLFTREFFELARGSLRDGGIYAQWLQIYGLAPETFRMLVRTFDDVFRYAYLASTLLHSDVLLIGSDTPLDFDPARIQARLTDAIAADLADSRVGIDDVWSLLARVRLGPEEVGSLGDSGPLNTDDLPYVAYQAPLEMFRETSIDNRHLLEAHDRDVVADAIGATDQQRALLVSAWRQFLRGHE